MKKDYISHLFVPPRKDITETIGDIVDDVEARTFGGIRAAKAKIKKIKDGMILYNKGQR